MFTKFTSSIRTGLCLTMLVPLVLGGCGQAVSAQSNDRAEFAKEYDGTQEYVENTVVWPVADNFVVHNTTYDELLEKPDGDYYVLFSAEWCFFCQLTNGILSKAAADSNKEVYYINEATSPRSSYTIIDGKVIPYVKNDSETAFINKYGEENFETETVEGRNGEVFNHPTIKYPTLFHVSNGKIERLQMPSMVEVARDGLTENEAQGIYKEYYDFFLSNTRR